MSFLPWEPLLCVELRQTEYLLPCHCYHQNHCCVLCQMAYWWTGPLWLVIITFITVTVCCPRWPVEGGLCYHFRWPVDKGNLCYHFRWPVDEGNLCYQVTCWWRESLLPFQVTCWWNRFLLPFQITCWWRESVTSSVTCWWRESVTISSDLLMKGDLCYHFRWPVDEGNLCHHSR